MRSHAGASADDAPALTDQLLRKGIWRKALRPIAAGPDAPEAFHQAVRREQGRASMSIANPNYKARKRG